MTQTYLHLAAVERMRDGKCPECGAAPEDHSAVAEFWLRDPLRCDLLPHGVTDRIAAQRVIDGTVEAKELR
jgi:hypothetical protein